MRLHTHGYVSRKRRIYGLIKLITFLLILFICLEFINNIVRKKEAYYKMNDFFEQKENFDVLFFGSSHSYMTVYPIELWGNYGIVSYNMGQTASTLAISYYNMLLAMKKTKPKLVVIDSYFTHIDEKVFNNNFSNSMHYTFDPYPLSYTKFLAIKDLCQDRRFDESIAEFLFNFSIYHNRWDELSKEDFKENKSYIKGAQIRTKIVKSNKMSNYEDVEIYKEQENVNMLYLRKIIEYCNDNNINILVTYNPYPATNKEIAISKYIQNICNDYNVNYINFLATNIINYDIDCHDKNSHLNQSGARKVTDYLGKYIMENYDIPDQRRNEAYNFWNQDYDEYIDFKINNLKDNEKNLNNYLMLLYGEKDIDYKITISSKRKIEEGSTLKNLLENLNNNYMIDDETFVKNKNKTIKITTYDNRTGKEINTIWF